MNVSDFLWRDVMPQAAVFIQDGHICASVWDGAQWQQEDTLPAATLLGNTILLKPESETSFRLRSFTVDLPGKDALAEAVELDAEVWSPYPSGGGRYYWPIRHGEQWQVAVWTWQDNTTTVTAPARITHILPESAWRIATLRGCLPKAEKALVIWPSQDGFVYAWVDEFGMPCQIAAVSSQEDAIRFWRALGSQPTETSRLFLLDEADPQSLPWLPDIHIETVSMKLPAASVLRRARLAGVQDWTDPIAWKKPLLALVLLALIWQAGTSAIVWKRSAMVEADLQRLHTSAEAVLARRDHVQSMQGILATIYRLRQRQGRELRFLAGLSQALPQDAWLLSVEDTGESVNLQGRARNAATIGALLERIPDIDHAAYLGDIRPDPVSKFESFYVRLHFHQTGEK